MYSRLNECKDKRNNISFVFETLIFGNFCPVEISTGTLRMIFRNVCGRGTIWETGFLSRNTSSWIMP